MDINKIMSFILVFSFIAGIIMPISLFMYVGMNDYLFYNVDQFSQNFTNSSNMRSEVYSEIESTWDIPPIILGVLDKVFLGVFVFFVSSLIYLSYYSKRAGYFTLINFLTFGVMIMLFLSSIFLTTTQHISNLILSSIESLSVDLVFYTIYIENIGLIHFTLFLVCLFINFIDFDLSTFKKKKNDEGGEEIQ